DAARAPHAQAVLGEQVEDEGQGFLVRDLEGEVDRRISDVGGDSPQADALGDRAARALELAVGDPVVHGRAHGVGGGDADLRVLRLEVDGGTGQGAAGADRAGEAVDAPVGLFPDLGAGGVDVGLAVGEVLPLVGVEHAIGGARL